MKKSLLALAVLGAFAASAQAQVTIGGIVQASAYQWKVSNTTRVTETENRVDDAYPSRFWLTGQEDIGGGNSAIFYIENRLCSTDASTATPGCGAGLGNGDTFVGLKGGWGQFTAGKSTWISAVGLTTEVYNRQNTLAAINADVSITYSLANEFGGGFRSIAGGALSTYTLDPGTRRSNALTYTTPSFGGFTAKFGASTNGAGNEGVQAGTTNYYSDGREYFLQGAYTNGPIYVNLSYWDKTGEGRNAVNDVKQTRLAGHYLFPFGLKVGLILDNAKSQFILANTNFGPSVSRNVIILPISYSFGNSTILGSYGKAYDLKGNTATDAVHDTGSSTGATMATLAYDYAFSRRTSVGAYYMKMHNSQFGGYTPLLSGASNVGGTQLQTGEQATVIGATIKHYF